MSQPNETLDPLSDIAEKALAGNRLMARMDLEPLLPSMVDRAEAWIWHAWLSDSPAIVRTSLERALAIAPENQAAIAGLQWVESLQQLTRTSTNQSVTAGSEELAPSETSLEDVVGDVNDLVETAHDATTPEADRPTDSIERFDGSSNDVRPCDPSSSDPQDKVDTKEPSDAVDTNVEMDVDEWGSFELDLDWEQDEEPDTEATEPESAPFAEAQCQDPGAEDESDAPMVETEIEEPVDVAEADEPVAEVEVAEPIAAEFEAPKPVCETEATEPVELLEPIAEIESADAVEQIGTDETVCEIEPTEPFAEADTERPVVDVETETPVERAEDQVGEIEESEESVRDNLAELAALAGVELDGEAEPEPVVAPEPIEPVAQLPEKPARQSESTVILIVDDSPTVRKLVTLTLERVGYEVLTAENGVEALNLIAQQCP
ncbi:MAG: hypothetical protein AAGA03_05685, partial [Planctomycetota bacterium]